MRRFTRRRTSRPRRWPGISNGFICTMGPMKAGAAISARPKMANRFLQEWTRRIHHWSSMFAGTSYYHLPQKLGRVFVPGELKGYFNDLTGKTDWKGKIDQNGFPVNTLTNGDPVYFPILLCQKALGHWDRWLLDADQEHRKQFLKIAEWLTSRQDSRGGWETWGTIGQ